MIIRDRTFIAKPASDALWKLEKRFYNERLPRVQNLDQSGIHCIPSPCARTVTRENCLPTCHHKTRRGMDFEHDVHDWLGGYPYEIATCWRLIV